MLRNPTDKRRHRCPWDSFVPQHPASWRTERIYIIIFSGIIIAGLQVIWFSWVVMLGRRTTLSLCIPSAKIVMFLDRQTQRGSLSPPSSPACQGRGDGLRSGWTALAEAVRRGGGGGDRKCLSSGRGKGLVLVDSSSGDSCFYHQGICLNSPLSIMWG